MFTRLRLWNFQPHRRIDIDLGQITFIVGPSMKGKTAILRALRWVCLARPAGNSFINHEAKSCKVELTADDHIIIRRRGRTKPAVYKLDGKVFRAAGLNVPDEIAELLNVSESNFQKQLDSPFWVVDSPAQIARNLNEIVNLDIIDSTLSELSSRIRKATTVVEVSTDRVKELKQTVKSLSWVEECSEDLDRLTAVQVELENLLELRRSLRHTLQRGKVATRARRELLGAKAAAERVMAHATRSRKLASRREGLERSLGKAVQLYKERERLAEQLETIRKQLDNVKECPTCGRRLKRKSKQSQSPTCTSHTSHRSRGKRKGSSGTK